MSPVSTSTSKGGRNFWGAGHLSMVADIYGDPRDRRDGTEPGGHEGLYAAVAL
jgi:hypothetical protein